MNSIKISSFAILALLFFQALAQEGNTPTQLDTQIAPDHPNIRYNGTLYSIVTEKQAELHRYSKDYFENGMDGTLNEKKARTQPGVSLSIKTNSPLVKLNFAELENSDIRKRRFTIFKNGDLAYDHISDLEFVIANPAKDTAEWEVYLPYFSGTKFLGLELSGGFELAEPVAEEKPLYMAIGNSITHGVGQSGTIETYPYKVADALDFRHINLATGGSRISTETTRNFKDVSPELITILWGYNDVNQEQPLSEVIPVYNALVDSLCEKFPEADIYCILQTFTTTEVGRRNENNRIDSLRSWTQSSVEKLQKKYGNLFLVDGAKYATSEADLKDRVHLNAQGATKLAKGIVAEYKANKNRINGCFPAEHLPDHITPLSEFGQRSEWSHDGKHVYFVDKAGGEVWKVNVKTKELTQITRPEFRPEGHGYYRVYELSNGDLLFTCGPERHDLYMQILKKGAELPLKINESIDEGPALSRTDMKIVWTPDQQVIYLGEIVYDGDKITIKDKRLIVDNDEVVVDGIKYNGILEPQNFIRPEEKLVIWTQYGNTKAGLFTSEVMVYNLGTDEMFNYSKSPNVYSEPEGIFPDGKYTLIECDKHCLKGIKYLDLYKLKLDGTGQDLERLSYFNDVEGYKASNPVVSDDGKFIAFQAAFVKMDTGVGCGIYLFDLEKWEKAKNNN